MLQTSLPSLPTEPRPFRQSIAAQNLHQRTFRAIYTRNPAKRGATTTGHVQLPCFSRNGWDRTGNFPIGPCRKYFQPDVR